MKQNNIKKIKYQSKILSLKHDKINERNKKKIKFRTLKIKIINK
jgi:hypothetical protein